MDRYHMRHPHKAMDDEDDIAELIDSQIKTGPGKKI